MKNKCISLSEEDIKLLKKIRQENNHTSDGQTISFLIHQFINKDDVAVLIRKELEENYLPKERIRWGVQTAEQNSIILLDAINTLLWTLNTKTCYRVDEIVHPVLKQSRDELNKKIAHFKQKSDERKQKGQQ